MLAEYTIPKLQNYRLCGHVPKHRPRRKDYTLIKLCTASIMPVLYYNQSIAQNKSKHIKCGSIYESFKKKTIK